jgi:putative ABC transport system permease protein
VTEVALSLALLVGAGLMVRSLVALNRVDLGFEPSGVLAANISFPSRGLSDEGL